MIPVEEIPHLMCALGYFPTQLEITNMTNEVKYSKFAETSTLDLDEKNLRNRDLFLCLVGFWELYILIWWWFLSIFCFHPGPEMIQFDGCIFFQLETTN